MCSPRFTKARKQYVPRNNMFPFYHYVSNISLRFLSIAMFPFSYYVSILLLYFHCIPTRPRHAEAHRRGLASNARPFIDVLQMANSGSASAVRGPQAIHRPATFHGSSLEGSYLLGWFSCWKWKLGRFGEFIICGVHLWPRGVPQGTRAFRRFHPLLGSLVAERGPLLGCVVWEVSAFAGFTCGLEGSLRGLGILYAGHTGQRPAGAVGGLTCMRLRDSSLRSNLSSSVNF